MVDEKETSESSDSNSLVNVPPFQIPLPYITKQRYSELTGQEIGVVNAQVNRGHIPSRLIGKHRLVNLARMWIDALSEG